MALRSQSYQLPEKRTIRFLMEQTFPQKIVQIPGGYAVKDSLDTVIIERATKEACVNWMIFEQKNLCKNVASEKIPVL